MSEDCFYITSQRGETVISRKEKVIVGSAALISGRSVENMVESAREKAEHRKRRQRGRKACLHGLYFRRVFCGSKMADCAILREANVTAREVVSHRALNWKLSEVRKPQRGNREELAGENARLKNELRRLRRLLQSLRKLCGDTKRVKAQRVKPRKDKVVVVAGEPEIKWNSRDGKAIP